MNKSIIIYTLFYAIVTIGLTTACTDETLKPKAKEEAAAKITDCTSLTLSDSEKSARQESLSVEDYTLLGVDGVDEGNLQEVNTLICSQPYANVDSADKMSALVAGLNPTPTPTPSPVNHPPIATAQSLTLEQDSSIDIILSGTDKDGNILTPDSNSYSQPSSGRVTLIGIGTYRYTPTHGYLGRDSFEFIVKDSSGLESAPATITLEIIEKANIPPVADAGEDQEVYQYAHVTLEGSGEDEDGTIEKYEWKLNGATKKDKQNYSFQAIHIGTFEYNLTVTDDRGATSSDTVELRVLRQYIPPVQVIHPQPVNGTIHFKSIELK